MDEWVKFEDVPQGALFKYKEYELVKLNDLAEFKGLWNATTLDGKGWFVLIDSRVIYPIPVPKRMKQNVRDGLECLIAHGDYSAKAKRKFRKAIEEL